MDKTRYVLSLYVIVILNFLNDKNTIKQLMKYFQGKWSFFVV